MRGLIVRIHPHQSRTLVASGDSFAGTFLALLSRCWSIRLELPHLFTCSHLHGLRSSLGQSRIAAYTLAIRAVQKASGMSKLNVVRRPCHESFARFLGSGRHSDFVIECRGHIFKVHKTLLCAKSEFFDRLCDSSFQEGFSARVQLDDEDPATVARMLLFIYTNAYPISDVAAGTLGHGQFHAIEDSFKHDATDKAEWVNRAKLHALMYAAADKYSIDGLQNHSAHRFLAAFCEYEDIELDPENGVFNRCDNYDSAPSDRHLASESESHSQQENPSPRSPSDPKEDPWIKEAEIIRLVYTSTPTHCRTLRHAVVRTIKRCSINHDEHSPLESDSILTVLHELPELAFDLASTVMSNRSYPCSNCNTSCQSLVTRCKCRKLDRCIEPVCLHSMQQESICAGCHCFGTILFATEGIEGDANSVSA